MTPEQRVTELGWAKVLASGQGIGHEQRLSIALIAAEADLAASRAEVQRLRREIDKAPHDPYCAVIQRPPGGMDCTCWKSRAALSGSPIAKEWRVLDVCGVLVGSIVEWRTAAIPAGPWVDAESTDKAASDA